MEPLNGPRADRAERPGASRHLVAVAAAIGGLALAASGCATGATAPAVSRNPDGSVAIDASRLRPVYDGRYVTADQLGDLQHQGKATAGVNNRELACQGITLYVDNEAETQAVQDDFDRRHPVATLAVKESGPASDPCAPFADSPQFVTDSG